MKKAFKEQLKFQYKVTKENLPVDSTYWCSYHTQAMMEELGEFLKADKRWKTIRNSHYDPENKLEELSDVFITAMNLAIFSGFTYEQVLEKITSKIDENNERLELEEVKWESL